MLMYGKINFPIWCDVEDLNALGTFHTSMHKDKKRCVRFPRGDYDELNMLISRWRIVEKGQKFKKGTNKRTKSLKERSKRSCVGIHFPTFVLNLWECVWVLGNSHGLFDLFSCLVLFANSRLELRPFVISLLFCLIPFGNI